MKKIILLFLVVLISCNKDDFGKEIKVDSKIVVEGWIEEGDVAQVILSRSIPINADIDSTTILNHIIRSAKVTVTDGENEEVLRLKNNNHHIPPFVYYGTEIIGKVGKNYTLKVEYLNKRLEATTSIPNSVPISSVDYVKDSPTDTKGYLFVSFDDPVNGKNFYQIETLLVKHDSLFIPALYGNLNDDNFASPKVTVQIFRGKSFSFEDHSKYKNYYEDGDLIYVKLRTMDKVGFDFWNSWQNEIINGQSPIFPNTTSLKSNIDGGIGIWSGYGQSIMLVKTPPKK
jgi:hypothetical protein